MRVAAVKYHLGPKGPGVCRSQRNRCPYGGETGQDDHFYELRQAQSAYEERMQKFLFQTYSKKGKRPQLNLTGIPTPRHREFAYLKSDERERFHRAAKALLPLVNRYHHDYNADDPDSRPGEREYLNSYDLTRFGGRDASADVLLMKIDSKDGKLKILMVQRGNHPYKNTWAHPGGFINYDETVGEAAARELREESGIALPADQMAFVKRYDDARRDPRGPLKMNTHVVLTNNSTLYDEGEGAGDDAQDARWIAIENIYDGTYPICGDHRLSIKDAVVHLSTMQKLAS